MPGARNGRRGMELGEYFYPAIKSSRLSSSLRYRDVVNGRQMKRSAEKNRATGRGQPAIVRDDEVTMLRGR